MGKEKGEEVMENFVNVPLTKSLVIFNRDVTANYSFTYILPTQIFKTAYLFYSISGLNNTYSVNLKVSSVVGNQEFVLKNVSLSTDIVAVETLTGIGDQLKFEVNAGGNAHIFVAIKLFT